MTIADGRWFEGVRLLGALPQDERADYLRRIGDTAVDRLADNDSRFIGPGETKPFDHTGSQVGFIRPAPEPFLQIIDPRDVEPDRHLAGQRVTVQLTQALIVRYPGRGVHEILVHVDAGDREMRGDRVQFSSTIRCRDGSSPPLSGQILFSGLLIGRDGLSVRLRTVNVHSEDDAKLLAVLQTEVFRKGLDLVASVGPAVGLLSQTLNSVAHHIANRAENRSVQDGLLAAGIDRDLVDVPKLRPGTYVFAQAPPTVDGRVWSWAEYVYDRAHGAIVHSRDRDAAIGYNYIAIGIGRMPK